MVLLFYTQNINVAYDGTNYIPTVLEYVPGDHAALNVINGREAIHMHPACPPHKRVLTGCCSHFMRLIERLTALRA